jgi:hypothetical protein
MGSSTESSEAWPLVYATPPPFSALSSSYRMDSPVLVAGTVPARRIRYSLDIHVPSIENAEKRRLKTDEYLPDEDTARHRRLRGRGSGALHGRRHSQ